MGRSALDCVIRFVILLGFSYLLFRLISTGEVLNYVHPRFLNLLKLTSGVLLVMAVVQFCMIFSSGHLHYPRQGNCLLVYGIPLLVGLLLSPRALDSYMARQKGVDVLRQAITETNSSQLNQDSIAKDNESLPTNICKANCIGACVRKRFSAPASSAFSRSHHEHGGRSIQQLFFIIPKGFRNIPVKSYIDKA